MVPQGLSRNAWLVILSSALLGLSDSLTTGNICAAYLFRLAGTNEKVGYAEAVFGLAQLVTALPVGYLSDKIISRRRCANLGAVLLAFQTAATIVVLLVPMDAKLRYYGYTICMAVQGLCSGILNGPVQALLADETPDGKRSSVYTLLFVAYLFPSILGPIVSICLFLHLGNHWGIEVLKIVLCVGFALQALNCIPLLCFERTKQDDDMAAKRAARRLRAGAGVAEPLLDPSSGDSGFGSGERDAAAVKGDDALANAVGVSWFGVPSRQVPFILFSANLLIALGSGATTKFFPLFFLNNLKLSPIQVQCIYLCVPAAMGASSAVCRWVSGHLGRVSSIMWFKLAGISLLCSMWAMEKFSNAYTVVRHPIVMVAVYVARTAIINSTYPVEESILMDCCKPSQRSRWKALESVSSFGWCGSAVIGGVLSDKHGYGFTFLITACLQFGSTLIYSPLLGGAVPLEVRTKTEDANGETDGETNGIDDAASFGEALTPPSGDSAVTVDVNPSS